jgi:GNAT superfamily N-acetyltransferase
LPRPFAIDGTITMRMVLPRLQAVAPVQSVEVREVAREQVERSLARPELGPGTCQELDEIAPLGWRCFAAFASGQPVHHTFVAYRREGPELFRVLTAPDWRGRGVFRAVVGAAATSLWAEGAQVLSTKLSLRNAASLRAHLSAGFVEVDRRRDPVVFGINLRFAAVRLWHTFRRRPSEP